MINQIGAFVDAGCDVREDANVIANVIKGFLFVRTHEVLVGIPQEQNAAHGKVTNAELLFIHSKGSPINNIPARPTIEPALAEHETAEAIQEQLINCIRSALFGNVEAAERSMHAAGMIGASAAQKKFGSGDLAPNAPITIHGGWMRNKVSGKLFYVPGKKSEAPLIDTGSLRSAITHVVRRT